MVGVEESSYYRKPSNSKKGNKLSRLSYHHTKGVEQATVLNSIKWVWT